MSNKQSMQTMFALCTAALLTAGCSNEAPDGDYGNSKDASVVFNLGLPQGDEVQFTRADAPLMQDESERTVNSLKVYDFKKNDANVMVLANVYTLKQAEATDQLASGSYAPTATTAQYQVRISIPGSIGEVHQFAFLANDGCTAFEDAMVVGTTTLNTFRRSVADKVMSNNSTTADFLGTVNGLAMTGITDEITLKAGENTQQNAISLTRLVARFDAEVYVSEQRNFELISLQLKNAALNGYLFDKDMDGGRTASIWDYVTPAPLTLGQNPVFTTTGYNSTLPDANRATISDNGRPGVWYKKVFYAYEYLATRGGTSTPSPSLLVGYKLNGAPNTVEIKLVDGTNNKRFDILRNYIYTLQIGDTKEQGQELAFSIKVSDWEYNEINSNLE